MNGILCIQINSVTGNKEYNFQKVERFLEENKNKKIDLTVLPEFFATNNDYTKYAEPSDGGAAINFLCKSAKKYNTNIIAGTVVRKKNDGLYNSSFAIDRRGEIIKIYDKIHLYNYFGGTEGERIRAGKETAVAEFDFAKVGMSVCFDIRYPEHFRKLIRQGAEIIVLPTAWLIPDNIYNNPVKLKSQREMWISMCRTRAFDNEVYFIVSNQTKSAAKTLSGLGCSMIIAPDGEILGKAESEECAIYAEADLNLLKKIRQEFPPEALLYE